MEIYAFLDEFLDYAVLNELLDARDRIYAQNKLLAVLKLDSFTKNSDSPKEEIRFIGEILKDISEYAVKNDLIEDRASQIDIFCASIMDILMDKPSGVEKKFFDLFREDAKKATDFYYEFSQKSYYIKADRIAKDMRFIGETEFGEIDITINLSKPEKDPKDIIAAAKQTGHYPECMLCKENEGYQGRTDFPSRSNHRTIALELGHRKWYFQYSPYVYYNEHCIAFREEHSPMKIDRSGFQSLLDFVDLFPHYFIGENAALPVSGGSILSHDHFQGGCYEFPVMRAETLFEFRAEAFPRVRFEVLKWPVSVVKLTAKKRDELEEAMNELYEFWCGYNDPEAGIFSKTEGTPHNTVTPIVRKEDGKYVSYIFLRNNLITKESPEGVFHPRRAYHHIKKENIGIIEVMGLAILPGRLKASLKKLEEHLQNGSDPKLVEADPQLLMHADWYREIQQKHHGDEQEDWKKILFQSVAEVFSLVLKDTGVFKSDESGRKNFEKFVRSFCKSVK